MLRHHWCRHVRVVGKVILTRLLERGRFVVLGVVLVLCHEISVAGTSDHSSAAIELRTASTNTATTWASLPRLSMEPVKRILPARGVTLRPRGTAGLMISGLFPQLMC